MGDITKKIGLSLGADLCWPTCYEEILRRLDLKLPVGDDTVSVVTERLTIEPFDLKQPCRFDVVHDRVTHWYGTSREWIKKAILLDDLYVLNNPWTLQSMEKQTSYCAMMRLGFPIPDTWMVPPKSYLPSPDLQDTLDRYAKMFDLGEVGESLGFPMFMKPYDGGAWVGVSRIADEAALLAAYEQSGTHIMHLQKSVEPYELFVRCVGVGPQVRIVSYDPAAPLHARYETKTDFVDDEQRSLLEDMTLTINDFFGWDFNSCEMLLKEGVFHPIDFANACPDSQVTSLHYHFPWLVQSMLEWTIFCAATGRKMHKTVDWTPYLEIAETDLPFREKLSAYAEIARGRLDADAFAAFKKEHLAQLPAVIHEFFGSEIAKEAVRGKVASLFPEHEHETFTEYFWERIQWWRDREGVAS